jgi:hypothetical protein
MVLLLVPHLVWPWVTRSATLLVLPRVPQLVSL